MIWNPSSYPFIDCIMITFSLYWLMKLGFYVCDKIKKNNTLEEEIIIDDIDVSECEHLTEIQGCWLSTCDYLRYNGNITNKLCKYNPNCYFKQLKRKEKELHEVQNEQGQ